MEVKASPGQALRGGRPFFFLQGAFGNPARQNPLDRWKDSGLGLAPRGIIKSPKLIDNCGVLTPL